MFELEVANKVTSAGLSNEELHEIFQYVEEKFKGRLDLESVLALLQRTPDKNSD